MDRTNPAGDVGRQSRQGYTCVGLIDEVPPVAMRQAETELHVRYRLEDGRS
jgi:hypothetical protein